MQEKHISFYSEGCKLQGTLYLPENFIEGKKYPAIIPNSGYQGFNEFYPRLFAEKLTKLGYICLGFDYRGFADSEGESGRVILSEQVEDIINATHYLTTVEAVDSERIGLIGWGMGGNNVVHAAAKDKRVKAVAALNGFYDGERWLRSIHTYVEWTAIKETIKKDQQQRVNSGKSELAATFIHYPLDPATSSYVSAELTKVPGFGKQTQLQFTESIINTNAEDLVKAISPRPLFIGHGTENLLHPLDESQSLYEAAAEPKELYLINGKHNDFMFGDHPVFGELIEELTRFFEKSLKQDQEETKS
ncbi:alpha/beta hydrolase [Bacillaceae bacterium IKA-2]|jgi:fermentation-respiration switch protein FrsA (DUF1100 family)|nr:alpha/beta hydrolase [Bacillaceae bacterium IKA-2]